MRTFSERRVVRYGAAPARVLAVLKVIKPLRPNARESVVGQVRLPDARYGRAVAEPAVRAWNIYAWATEHSAPDVCTYRRKVHGSAATTFGSTTVQPRSTRRSRSRSSAEWISSAISNFWLPGSGRWTNRRNSCAFSPKRTPLCSTRPYAPRQLATVVNRLGSPLDALGPSSSTTGAARAPAMPQRYGQQTRPNVFLP